MESLKMFLPQAGDSGLLKASKIGLMGIVLIFVAEFLATIITLPLVQAATKGMGDSPFMVMFIFGVIVRFVNLAVFTFLVVRVRKSKSKAISINLIVFGAIFATISLVRFMDVGIAPQMLVIVTVAIIGWILVLVAGILGTRVSGAEIEENRLG